MRPVVTERPVPPAGLTITGEAAPRNIPDPCALLTGDEVVAVLGTDPWQVIRSVEEFDSWACGFGTDDGSRSMTVTVFVNGAPAGWETDVDGGTLARSAPPVVLLAEPIQLVLTELGTHLVGIAVDDAVGEDVDETLLVDLAAVIARRHAP